MADIQTESTGQPPPPRRPSEAAASDDHGGGRGPDLELQFGVNFVQLGQYQWLDAYRQYLTLDEVRTYQCLPIAEDAKRITLALVNPNNLIVLDLVKLRGGKGVKSVVCEESDFQRVMNSLD